MKGYLVVGACGEADRTYKWAVRVYLDRDQAEAAAKTAEKEANALIGYLTMTGLMTPTKRHEWVAHEKAIKEFLSVDPDAMLDEDGVEYYAMEIEIVEAVGILPAQKDGDSYGTQEWR